MSVVKSNATPNQTSFQTTQLNLDLAIKFDASLSDVSSPNWESVVDLVRQLHAGLVSQLYLYGGQDTGKTHLLTAICESFRDMGYSAIYLSLRDLLTLDPMVLASVENMDMVAIDDIDAIQGYPDWQEAVFHLINRHYENQHPIIFASRVSVNALDFSLSDLVSRLAKAPTFELPSGRDREDRAMILQSILARRHWHFDERITTYLLDEGPLQVGAMLAVLEHIQPMFSNLGRSQVSKTVILEAFKQIDDKTLLYELKDLNLTEEDSGFLDF